MPIETFDGLDFSKILKDEGEQHHFLHDVRERAEAKLVPYVPVTPEERLAAFRKIDFYPHGIYLPDDEELQEKIRALVKQIGDITSIDDRLTAYHTLQEKTEDLWKRGVPGRWKGQQAMARSKAQFRISAMGRRGGKTYYAAAEAVAVAVTRPRSWCWCAAPTMKLTSRAFDYVLRILKDRGIKIESERNTTQERGVVLSNGSKIEAISLENLWSAAGAAIDFAVIDEAAQVYPEAWSRAILPPLLDRNGQALLISSYEGEGDFFQTKALEAQKEMLEHGTESDWEMFNEPSYESNIYSFPQGRLTPSLLRAERETPIHDFLEQYGAIPAGAHERIYPEFRDKVHVGDFRFDPKQPVTLAVDPSGGANPYAVAVIQDYGDYFIVVDEFYEAHISIEEIAPVLQKRVWRDNVRDMIVDSAWPADIDRWLKLGWPAYPVPNKPLVEERLPLLRNWLRDPRRYHAFYRRKVNEVLESLGLSPDSDRGLSEERQRKIAMEIEQSTSDINILPSDLELLRKCSRVFVSYACVHTIAEFKGYKYQRKKQMNLNFKEIPRDYLNHLMDAIGYFVWDRKRFYGEQPASEYDITNIQPVPVGLLENIETPAEYVEDAPPEDVTPAFRNRSFLAGLREMYTPEGRSAPRSVLRVCTS